MITLQGIAKFPLDCREFDQVLTVQCDVVCGFNDEGQPDMLSLTPVLASLKVGDVDVMEDQKVSELYGRLKARIEEWCAYLGLEGVGITDAQVKDALGHVEADWAHAREHAAGRV